VPHWLVGDGDDNILSCSSSAFVVPARHRSQKYQQNSPPKSHKITAPQRPKLCDNRVEGLYHAETTLNY